MPGRLPLGSKLQPIAQVTDGFYFSMLGILESALPVVVRSQLATTIVVEALGIALTGLFRYLLPMLFVHSNQPPYDEDKDEQPDKAERRGDL